MKVLMNTVTTTTVTTDTAFFSNDVGLVLDYLETRDNTSKRNQHANNVITVSLLGTFLHTYK